MTFAADSTSASGSTIDAFSPPISAWLAMPRAVAAAATPQAHGRRAGEGDDVGQLDHGLARGARRR